MQEQKLSVEWVPLARVYLSPSNPRLNDPAVEPVAASLRRFGWQQPIVARPSGEVIAGNTRLKAATKLGQPVGEQRDQLARSAAVRAHEHVDLEYSLHQLGPARARRGLAARASVVPAVSGAGSTCEPTEQLCDSGRQGFDPGLGLCGGATGELFALGHGTTAVVTRDYFS